MSLSSDWTKYEPGFCESKLFGEYNPEYLSGYSALVIIFFGLLGLREMPLPTSIWEIIFSFIAMNGIGSMAFHLTKQHGWGLIDGITMIIAFSLASYHCFHVIAYNYFAIQPKQFIDELETEISKETREYNSSWFHVVSSVGCFIHIFICCVFIGLNTYQSMTAYASLVMGLSLMVQFFIALKWLYNDDINVEFKKMKSLLIRSIILAIGMAAIWIIGEGLCDNPKYEWIKYIPHHALWHIVMAYALYGIGLSLLFMDAYNYGLKPYFKSDKWYYQIIPILRLKNYKTNAIVPAMSLEELNVFEIMEDIEQRL